MSEITLPELIPVEDIHKVAADVMGQAGATQMDAASRLDVSQPAITQALNPTLRRRMPGLCARIIEAYTGTELDGPFYRPQQK